MKLKSKHLKKLILSSMFSLLILPFLSFANADEFFPCKRLGRYTNCIASQLVSDKNTPTVQTSEALDAEKARIYIVRPFTQEPKTWSEVFRNGELVGILGPTNFLMLDLPTGTHHFMIKTGQNVKATEMQVDIQSQQTIYLQYQVNLKMGNLIGELDTFDSRLLQAKPATLKKVETISSE